MNPPFIGEQAQALLQQLREKYKLKRIELDVTGKQILIYKVEDIDLLLDQISDPEEIPFWAELWPASLGLAQYILGNQDLFRNQSVLELGSGVGLAGIAAKIAGAQTLQSDFMLPALDFCRLNCLLNQVSSAKLLLADWRKFPSEAGKFDFIVGSDILYEKTLHSDLRNIFERHLNQGGKIILADPGRDYAKTFLEQIKAKGWSWKTVVIPVIFEAKTYSIDIYLLSF